MSLSPRVDVARVAQEPFGEGPQSFRDPLYARRHTLLRERQPSDEAGNRFSASSSRSSLIPRLVSSTDEVIPNSSFATGWPTARHVLRWATTSRGPAAMGSRSESSHLRCRMPTRQGSLDRLSKVGQAQQSAESRRGYGNALRTTKKCPTSSHARNYTLASALCAVKCV